MTTPVDTFIYSYVLSPDGTGTKIAKIQQPSKLAGSQRIPIPPGVNTVSVTTLSPARLLVDLMIPGGEYIRQPRLEITAGAGQRTAVTDVPVHRVGCELQVTLIGADPKDVNQPVIGVKVFPAPPQ